jgi:multiple sugar transport system ATP-binding protein
LKLLHQQLKATMIYVTHDQVEAMTLATRIVVMRGGEVQQIGTPECVYERPNNLFVAGFLGAPAMNFLQGEINQAGAFQSGPLQLDLSKYNRQAEQNAFVAGRPVTIGIRPEHLHLQADGPLSATVTLVEPMGNHQVVWLELAAAQAQVVSAIVNEQTPFAIGQTVRLQVDTHKISLFDPQSEQRL